jgi:hypothetical protein
MSFCLNELANLFKVQPRSSRAGSRNVEKSTDTRGEKEHAHKRAMIVQAFVLTRP